MKQYKDFIKECKENCECDVNEKLDLKSGTPSDAISKAYKDLEQKYPEKSKEKIRDMAVAMVANVRSLKEEANPEDYIKMSVPLFIRVLEYAREDAKTDMDLHFVAKNSIKLGNGGDKELSMDDYENIIKKEK